MAASVRSFAQGSSSTTTITCDKPSGAVDGDVLVAFHGGDFAAASSMTAPAGWTQTGSTVDAGSNNLHFKVWWKVASSEGASYGFGQGTSSDGTVIIIAVQGADTSTPIHVAATGNTTSSSTSHAAPSISPTDTDALLLCGAILRSNGANTWTPPTGMTERGDVQSGTFCSGSAASLALSASGATGSKTFTSTRTHTGAVYSLAIKSAAAGGSVSGTISTTLGALTATAAGVPTTFGTVSQALGALTATASGVPTTFGAVASTLGGLTATAAGTSSKGGTAASVLGGLTATAAATVTVTGAVSQELGGLTATATGSIDGEEPPAPVPDEGSHGGGILGQTRRPTKKRPLPRIIFEAAPVTIGVRVTTTTRISATQADAASLATTTTSRVFDGADAELAFATTDAQRVVTDLARRIAADDDSRVRRIEDGDDTQTYRDIDDEHAFAALLARSHA